MKKSELVVAEHDEAYKEDMVMYERIREFDLKKMGLICLKNKDIPDFRTKSFYALLFMGYKPGPYLWEEKEEYDRCYAMNLDDSKNDEFAIRFNKRDLSSVETNFFIEEIFCPKVNNKSRTFINYDLYLSDNELFVLKKESEKKLFLVPEKAKKVGDTNFKYLDFLVSRWFNNYSKPAPAEGNPEVDYSITGEYDDLYRYLAYELVISSSNKKPSIHDGNTDGYVCEVTDADMRNLEKKIREKVIQNSYKYY